jgi:hypothetical protein
MNDNMLMPMQPGDKADDDHMRRVIDAINVLSARTATSDRVCIALASAISKQPAIDRTQLHADFIDAIGTFIISSGGEVRELNGFAATVAYYILKPDG